MSSHPSEDPIGTVRETQGHVYVKLAFPADEPWHIVWCAGEQNMSGWQSDECMVESTKWDGYLPVRECGEEGKDFVAWETYKKARDEVDKARTEAAKWKLIAEQPSDRELVDGERAYILPVDLENRFRDVVRAVVTGQMDERIRLGYRMLERVLTKFPAESAPSTASQEGSS